MRARWAMTLAAGLAVLLSMTVLPCVGHRSGATRRAYVLDDSDVLTPAEEADAEARLGAAAGRHRHGSLGGLRRRVHEPLQRRGVGERDGAAERARSDAVPDGRRHRSRQFYISGDSEGPLSPSSSIRSSSSRCSRCWRRTTGAERWMPRPPASRTRRAAAPGCRPSAAPGSGLFTGILWFLVIGLGVLLVVWLVIRSRRKKPAAGGSRSGGARGGAGSHAGAGRRAGFGARPDG